MNTPLLDDNTVEDFFAWLKIQRNLETDDTVYSPSPALLEAAWQTAQSYQQTLAHQSTQPKASLITSTLTQLKEKLKQFTLVEPEIFKPSFAADNENKEFDRIIKDNYGTKMRVILSTITGNKDYQLAEIEILDEDRIKDYIGVQVIVHVDDQGSQGSCLSFTMDAEGMQSQKIPAIKNLVRVYVVSQDPESEE